MIVEQFGFAYWRLGDALGGPRERLSPWTIGFNESGSPDPCFMIYYIEASVVHNHVARRDRIFKASRNDKAVPGAEMLTNAFTRRGNRDIICLGLFGPDARGQIELLAVAERKWS